MRCTRGIIFNICLCLSIVSFVFVSVILAHEEITPDQLNVFEPGQGNKILWDWMHEQADKLPPGEFPPNTAEEWDAQKTAVQQSVLQILGIDGLEKTPLNVEVVGIIDRPEFTVTKLRWQGRPGFYTLANLWKPKGVSGKLPAILWIPGHNTVGKAAYGWPQNIFVRKGFIVLAIDWVGYSERTPQNHAKNAVCWTVGTSVAGLEIWDDIRAMDYLLSRGDVDPARVGIAGRSGGGTQTMWLIGAEPRAAAYVPQAGLSTFQEAYVQRAGGHCLCNYTPGPLAKFNIAHILATGAPDKYIHVVNGTLDNLFPITGAKESVKQARQVYNLYGEKNRLQLFTDMGEHPATDKQIRRITQFFMKTLNPENQDFSIPEFEHLTPEELAVGLPTDSKTSIDMCREMRDALPAPKVLDINEWLKSAERLRIRLRDEVLGGFPERGPLNVDVREALEFENVIIERISIETEPGLRIPMNIYRPKGAEGKSPILIILTRAGKSWDSSLLEIDEMKMEEKPAWTLYANNARLMKTIIVTPDLRGLGEMAPGEKGKLKFMRNYLEYELATTAALMGRPLAGMRIYDVTRIVDYLVDRDDVDTRSISLTGVADMSHIVLLSGALDTRITALATWQIPATFFVGSLPETSSMDFYMPGILKVGDMPVIASLIAPRQLDIIGMRDENLMQMDTDQSKTAFDYTRQVYEVIRNSGNLTFHETFLP